MSMHGVARALAARRFVFLVAFALMTGCRHAPVSADAPPGGHSTFTFMKPPPAAPAEVSEATQSLPPEPCDLFVEAEPTEPLAVPAYPPAALAAHAGWSTVGVRLTIDPCGRVADVGPSLVCISSGGPFSEEFRAAVERAVARWQFNPAEVRHVKPYRGPTGRTYWQVERSQPVETTCDVLFTFTAGGTIVTDAASRGSRRSR